MRSSARSRDDDDVIRARLRVLLAQGQPNPGWVPQDDNDASGDRSSEGGDWPSDGRAWDDAAGWDDDPDDPEGSLRAEHGVALPHGLGRHRAPGPTARLDPSRPGAWALWAAALLAAAAVIGWTWVDRPAVEQVPAAVSTSTLTTAATPSGTAPADATQGPNGSVVVSVVGQVATPGLVTLPAGSRVADALAAAGGLLPDADPASINAAAVLSDGQQIAVGVPGALPPGSGGTAPAGSGGGGVLDLNTATVADLDALPGIGPVLAQRIVDHRTANGPFTSVEQLDDVSGIGPAIFADLVDRVRV